MIPQVLLSLPKSYSDLFVPAYKAGPRIAQLEETEGTCT